jgi:FixJ family two-component response regulator
MSEGDRLEDRQRMEQAELRHRDDSLTPREREVVARVVALLNEQGAAEPVT